MSRVLIIATALFATSIGGAFAQQVSTPTIWGTPYHGPTYQSALGTEQDRGASRLTGTTIRGDGKLMSLNASETIKAKSIVKHHQLR